MKWYDKLTFAVTGWMNDHTMLSVWIMSAILLALIALVTG
jgi:hypothetical protein